MSLAHIDLLPKDLDVSLIDGDATVLLNTCLTVITELLLIVREGRYSTQSISNVYLTNGKVDIADLRKLTYKQVTNIIKNVINIVNHLTTGENSGRIENSKELVAKVNVFHRLVYGIHLNQEDHTKSTHSHFNILLYLLDQVKLGLQSQGNTHGLGQVIERANNASPLDIVTSNNVVKASLIELTLLTKLSVFVDILDEKDEKLRTVRDIADIVQSGATTLDDTIVGKYNTDTLQQQLNQTTELLKKTIKYSKKLDGLVTVTNNESMQNLIKTIRSQHVQRKHIAQILMGMVEKYNGKMSNDVLTSEEQTKVDQEINGMVERISTRIQDFYNKVSKVHEGIVTLNKSLQRAEYDVKEEEVQKQVDTWNTTLGDLNGWVADIDKEITNVLRPADDEKGILPENTDITLITQVLIECIKDVEEAIKNVSILLRARLIASNKESTKLDKLTDLLARSVIHNERLRKKLSVNQDDVIQNFVQIVASSTDDMHAIKDAIAQLYETTDQMKDKDSQEDVRDKVKVLTSLTSGIIQLQKSVEEHPTDPDVYLARHQSLKKTLSEVSNKYGEDVKEVVGILQGVLSDVGRKLKPSVGGGLGDIEADVHTMFVFLSIVVFALALALTEHINQKGWIDEAEHMRKMLIVLTTYTCCLLLLWLVSSMTLERLFVHLLVIWMMSFILYVPWQQSGRRCALDILMFVSWIVATISSIVLQI